MFFCIWRMFVQVMLSRVGTFMKGQHHGILLSAVGKDGNEGKIV